MNTKLLLSCCGLAASTLYLGNASGGPVEAKSLAPIGAEMSAFEMAKDHRGVRVKDAVSMHERNYLAAVIDPRGVIYAIGGLQDGGEAAHSVELLETWETWGRP